MSDFNLASARQIEAADPTACTWLSANAGSGKTRVLIDRVARLLLSGVQPQRILCLTYTKAAAGEMQNRLFDRLGSWAMLDAARLRAALAEIGEGGDLPADRLVEARRLFARAIETPGGLKIQTIHSFCAMLLRRFPLEAGVSPNFRETDERTARLLQDEVIEAMCSAHPDAVDGLARHLTDEDLGRLTGAILQHRAAFATAPGADVVRAAFGLPAGFDRASLLAETLPGGEAALLEALGPHLDRGGKTTDQRAAARLARLVADWKTRAPVPADIAVLEQVLLTGAGAAVPFTARIGSFPTKAVREQLGPLAPPLQALMHRVEAARPRRLALAACERTEALHHFAARFLPMVEARKAARGWLDFDDLVLRAGQLLRESSVAQWVLFKLDGGIDHILVDEAQDTSPEQWKVIAALAREFTAGAGARAASRTIFVVGDRKQSIYSFQGADLHAFDAMQRHFDKALRDVQLRLGDLTLEYSFRSSQAILGLVDRTFATNAAQGLGGEVRHIAFRSVMPGRVDLWPAVEPAAATADRDWWDPVDLVGEDHHTSRLADQLADALAAMLGAAPASAMSGAWGEGRAMIPDAAAPGGARPLRPGDVLILVRRRSALFHRIIAACKARGLAVAGADVMRLGAEMAVRDLTALLAFLATPEDDLSLAAVLRSPLLGWDEAALHDLAYDRGGRFLWQALRQRDDAGPTLAMLTDLRDRADYLRPYELLERVLVRHDGRRRLVARLGQEAEDGIDALLDQALAHERLEVPSLAGFLTWLASDEVKVKRRADAAGDRIRVMTVHGAKGLEAPLVILPDTAARTRAPRPAPLLPVPVSGQDGAGAWVPTWRPPAAEMPPALEPAVAAREKAEREEDARLLYVAMTRAESWLIVAAAGKADDPACWHARIAAGMERSGALPHDFPTGKGLRHAHLAWPEAAQQPSAPPGGPAPQRPAGDDILPDWAVSPAPAPAEAPAMLSPSDLGGAKVLPGETVDGSPKALAASLRRGWLLHLMLEHLPAHPRDTWPALAPALAVQGPDPAPVDEALELLDEARALLDAPALAALFAPGTLAEVEIAAPLGTRRMQGSIDRLILAPDHVLAVDYKSNRLVPDRPEDVPEGLLRQMAAYRAGLAAVWPDRRIDCALLWTRQARLMRLADPLLDAALARALHEMGAA